ncbi:stomatin-like protein 2, mitochondrial isoform X2 [Athene noctua]|uniref:stomatin-like protein 2, mitochondrial isoform X2 n=1 Tax=Athene noctua TaxID=126797 RepID=UPI003EC04095
MAVPSVVCVCRAAQLAALATPQAPLTCLCWLLSPHDTCFSLCPACCALQGGWAEHPDPSRGSGLHFSLAGASYGVEDPEYAVTQLAQTTMRSELGKLSLDRVFRERESLNANIVDAINQASDCWGIRCLRYEIKDIHVPPRVKESMQMQVEAERRKRATVLESEGTRESAINVAEGQKQAQILASEAEKAEQINKAAGEANAMLVKARAKAEAIQLLAAALAQQNGSAAASLSVAEQYVNAFSKLAKDSNTLLLPTNTGDITSMVTQALGIYTTLTKPQAVKTQDEMPPAREDPQAPPAEVLKAEEASSS